MPLARCEHSATAGRFPHEVSQHVYLRHHADHDGTTGASPDDGQGVQPSVYEEVDSRYQRILRPHRDNSAAHDLSDREPFSLFGLEHMEFAARPKRPQQIDPARHAAQLTRLTHHRATGYPVFLHQGEHFRHCRIGVNGNRPLDHDVSDDLGMWVRHCHIRPAF
jgi:hypothetical protein